MSGKLSQALSAAGKGKGLTPKLARFVLVGAASSALYVALVWVYVEGAGTGPRTASVLAYLTTLPINFIAHRRFTFQVEGRVVVEAARFLVLHGCNMAVSLLGMIGMVEGLGQSYWLGAFAAAVLVPLTTFLVMNFWVFVAPKAR